MELQLCIVSGILIERNVAREFARDMNKEIYKYPVSEKNGGKNRGGMLAAGIW